jgi:hypothetical protein
LRFQLTTLIPGQGDLTSHEHAHPVGGLRPKGRVFRLLDQLQQHSACGSVSLFCESSTLFISPAGSASGSVKRTACTCTPHFHTFSLLSAALCVRARLLAGPRCHRLYAEWDEECCWKRRRIRRGERNCWPRVLGIRRGSLLELVLAWVMPRHQPDDRAA